MYELSRVLTDILGHMTAGRMPTSWPGRALFWLVLVVVLGLLTLVTLRSLWPGA